MDDESEGWAARRREIGERLAEIRTRINDLERAQRVARHPASSGGQLAGAQHYAAISAATARRALAASMQAFLRAASAHERCAGLYERAAAAGRSDKEERSKRAAFHRAAAAADRRRAVTTELRRSSLPGTGETDSEGTGNSRPCGPGLRY